MQNDGKFAGQRDLGELGAASFGDPHCPTAQTTPAPMMHEHMSCLIQRGAHHFVTAAADVAVIVDLSGAVAPWRQAEMRSHIARSLETLGDIDPSSIGQRDDD